MEWKWKQLRKWAKGDMCGCCKSAKDLGMENVVIKLLAPIQGYLSGVANDKYSFTHIFSLFAVSFLLVSLIKCPCKSACCVVKISRITNDTSYLSTKSDP